MGYQPVNRVCAWDGGHVIGTMIDRIISLNTKCQEATDLNDDIDIFTLIDSAGDKLLYSHLNSGIISYMSPTGGRVFDRTPFFAGISHSVKISQPCFGIYSIRYSIDGVNSFEDRDVSEIHEMKELLLYGVGVTIWWEISNNFIVLTAGFDSEESSMLWKISK